MALFYNLDGTVSDIVINALIEGKVTASNAAQIYVRDSVTAASASSIITSARAANSSSNAAYELAYPTDKTGWTSINGTLTSPKNQ